MRFGTVVGCLLFRFGGHRDADSVLLGVLAGLDQLDRLRAFGHGRFADLLDLFLGLDRLGQRAIGFGLGRRLFLRFLRDRDLTLLLGDPDDAFAFDLALFDRAALVDFALGDRAIGVDLGLFGFAMAIGFLLGDHRRGLGGTHLDFLVLRQARIFLVAGDLERLALGLQVLQFHLDLRVALDVVAFLAPQLDFLGQLGQALGVEGVLRVEEICCSLVESGQRHRFEFEAVLVQVLGYRDLDLLGEVRTIFVQFFHAHAGGHRA